MNETELLQTPPGEIEIAQWLDMTSKVLTPTGQIMVRRLAFQRDQLKDENARLKELVKELWDEVEYDSDHATVQRLSPVVEAALTGKETS